MTVAFDLFDFNHNGSLSVTEMVRFCLQCRSEHDSLLTSLQLCTYYRLCS